MNVHRRVVLALALTIAGMSTAAAADRLTGMWSAETRTKGGLGAQWVFAANGEVTMTFGALVDFTYTIAGNRITMTSAKDPASHKDPLVEEFVIAANVLEVEVQGRPTTVFDIALEDRALTLTQRDAGKVIRYTRFEY